MEVLELYFYVILYLLHNSVQVCGQTPMRHHSNEIFSSNSFEFYTVMFIIYDTKQVQTFSVHV